MMFFSRGFGDAKKTSRRRPKDHKKASCQSLEDRGLFATFPVNTIADVVDETDGIQNIKSVVLNLRIVTARFCLNPLLKKETK